MHMEPITPDNILLIRMDEDARGCPAALLLTRMFRQRIRKADRTVH